MSEKNIPAVSIIIPTLNEARYIGGLLESLLAAGEPMDITVVDGNSSDKTIEVVGSFVPRFVAPSALRIMSSARGIPLQRNTGAAAAKNEILMFLDADVIIPSREQYRLLISSFTNSGYSVAMPRLIPRESTWKTRLIYRIYYVWLHSFLLSGKPYFSGSCLLTSRAVFNTIGGFDTKLPVAEDVDFSCRAASLGHAGVLPLRIPVSARRFLRYGHGKMFWMYVREASIFAVTGKLRLEKIVYPFGEYDRIA